MDRVSGSVGHTLSAMPISGPGSGSVDFTDDLRLAHVLADDADSLTEARFKALDLHVMSKPDLSPVTDADQRGRGGHPAHAVAGPLARRRHRRGARHHRPQPAALGGRPDRRHQELRPRRARVGHPDRPGRRRRGRARRGVGAALQRRWWASKGDGAWTGRSLLKATRCQVSDVRRLEDASLSYSSLAGWDERGRLDDFLSLSRRCWRTRAYGDFWSYMLLAEGAVDIAAEPELELYDMAALDVIVREAGGRFTSLDGTDGPFGRQRAGHQRPPARRGAGVPRLAPRRRGDPDAARAATVHDLSSDGGEPARLIRSLRTLSTQARCTLDSGARTS